MVYGWDYRACEAAHHDPLFGAGGGLIGLIIILISIHLGEGVTASDGTVALTGQRMWRGRRVVWDPDTLSWRDPRADELETPADLPENTPFQKTLDRNTVPFECLSLDDDYARTQAKALELQGGIKTLADELQFAQDELNKQLAKFTLKLGFDVGSLVAQGATGIHDASKLTKYGGLGQKEHWVGPSAIYGELNAALAAARKRLHEIMELIEHLATRLVDAVSEAAEKSAVLRRAYEFRSEERDLEVQIGTSIALHQGGDGIGCSARLILSLRLWVRSGHAPGVVSQDYERTVHVHVDAKVPK